MESHFKMKPSILFHCLVIIWFSSMESDSISVDHYLDIIVKYSKFRFITIWTHITCYDSTDKVKISTELSSLLSVQSRHISDFQSMRYEDDASNTIQGYALDITCEHNFTIFEQADQAILFRNNHFWLLFDESLLNEGHLSVQAKYLLESLNVFPISEVLVVQFNKYLAKYFLIDVYKIAKNYPLEMSTFGTAQAHSVDLQVTQKFRTKLTRKNLQGIKLRCALVIAFPEKFTFMDDPVTSHIDTATKSTYPMMMSLRQDLNFTCNVMQVDSYGWLMNNTWDGAMALYAKGKVDLMIHGTSMRVDRLELVEFTTDLAEIETPIIFRQPSLAAITNIFVLPLRYEVWRACFLAMIIVWFLMLTQYIYPEVRRQISYLDIIEFICAAACQQSTVLTISKTSGRIIVLSTFILSLFVFISYSANILVLLQSPSHAIKTVDDLIASPLKLSVQDAKYLHFYYETDNKGLMSRVHERKIKPNGQDSWIYDTAMGVRKVRTQLFAFQLESAIAYKWISKTFTDDEKCSLTEMYTFRVPRLTATIVRNSPYKELFRQRLHFQRENGLMAHEHVKWFPKKPICENNANKMTPVGIIEIKSALLILVFGSLAAFVILSIEMILKKMSNMSKMLKMLVKVEENLTLE